MIAKFKEAKYRITIWAFKKRKVSRTQIYTRIFRKELLVKMKSLLIIL